jgi:60 kDa SS-A/Ro ribonucleoprotein
LRSAHPAGPRRKTFFHSAFNKVVKTPGDLLDFVAVIGSIRKGKGFGRTVKRAINNWLTGEGSETRQNGLSQYHAIKYGGGDSSKKWTLKDVIKISHPIPKNDTQSWLFKYLTQGELNPNLEQINAVEQLKRLSTQKKELELAVFEANVNQLIDVGRLPYEIVTGIIKPTVKIWEQLMRQMPIFALVRNLNTLSEAGVFNSKDNVDWAVGQLTNPDIITRSRMLPFRFSTAYDNFKGSLTIKNALKTSLDLSLSNMDMLPGKNAYFLDVSGSMSGNYLQIGSLLGIAAVKKSSDSMFLCFGSELKLPEVDPRDTVMTNMDKCKKVFGGGTSIDLCIKHLFGIVGKTVNKNVFGGSGYNSRFPESEKTTTPVSVDNIVIITDEQQNSGSSVVAYFREYRKKVNKNAKLFIIDIAPYDSRMANQNEPGVTFIYGWSDSVLSILRYAMEGSGSHVDQIKNIRL